MPKRIVDGEAIASSRKLRSIRPEFRIHFPYLLTLALANGVFECDPKVIQAIRYAYFLPDFSAEDIAKMLNAFEKARILFRWKTSDGKTWGFWVGIDKRGRLPPSSQVFRKEQACGPPVPVEQLRKFLGDTMVSPTGPHGDTKDGLGLGLVLEGSGLGPGMAKNQTQPSTEKVLPAAATEDSELQKLLDAIAAWTEQQVFFTVLQQADIVRLLETHAAEEIESVFRIFWDGCDAWEQKRAAKTFLTTVTERLRALRKSRAQAVQDEALLERVTEQARLKMEAEDAARLAPRKDEVTDSF